MPFIDVSGLTKSYQMGGTHVSVLRNLDVTVERGEMVAIVGASGVGKSTLLHVLGGLDSTDGGEVRIGGTRLGDLSDADLVGFRNRHVGFVFQFHHLLPEFTALENVEMPFRIGRRSEGASQMAAGTLKRLGLGDRLDHRPAALSGGEQQRVAIARALAPSPDLVLADEPTGNLDSATGASILGLLRELWSETGLTVVLITHDAGIAAQAQRLIQLADGRITNVSRGVASLAGAAR
jgi:lipoprotein-releasing system ATP-binding protein